MRVTLAAIGPRHVGRNSAAVLVVAVIASIAAVVLSELDAAAASHEAVVPVSVDDLGHPVGAASGVISRNGRFIAYGTYSAVVFDTATGSRTSVPEVFGGAPTGVSDDGNKVAFEDGTVVDIASQQVFHADVPHCEEYEDEGEYVTGGQRKYGTFGGSMSADGRYVVYIAMCEGWTRYESWYTQYLVLRDLSSNGVEEVLDTGGWHSYNPERGLDFPTISATGRYVAWLGEDHSQEENCDCTFERLMFLDRETGTVTDLVTTTDGEPLSGRIGGNISLSDDGRFVGFTSSATNIAGGVATPCTCVYVLDRLSKSLSIVTTRPDGQPANGDNYAPELSASGDKMVFRSTSTDLTGTAQVERQRIYLKDLATSTLSVIDDDSGFDPCGYACDPYCGYFGTPCYRTCGRDCGLAIDGSGTRIAFASASALANGDSNEIADVYLYDARGGSADLVVSDANWSPTATAGIPITFRATIRNIGTGWSPPGVIHGVLFQVNGENTTWSDNYVGAIPPGASVTVTANGGPSGSSTWAATAGTHTLRAIVDGGGAVNRIPESNDDNNTLTTTITVPHKVVLLAGSAEPPAGDVPIVNRLRGLGAQVVVVDDDAFTTSSLNAASLLVVSPSVVSSKVPTWLATTSIPILNGDTWAQTRLRMASSASELTSKTTLRIVNVGHPLAATRTGDVVVQSSTNIAVANPAPGAAVVARVPGASTASLYGIETGAALTSGSAPARRVGFFSSIGSPPRLTAAGWALFDAAVSWLLPVSSSPPTTTTTSSTSSTTTTTTTSSTTTSSTTTTTTTTPSGATVVVLAGSTELHVSDQAIVDRLENLGWQVTVADDDGFSTSSLSNASLLVISPTVITSNVPTSLAIHDIPILNGDTWAQTRLKMASSASELQSKTTLRIADTGHPLAGGKSGDVVVQNATNIAVASPASGAAVIARVPGATTASLYGIDEGAALTSGTAPARRVGFFTSINSPPNLTAAGWDLFDAAVRWLAGAATTPTTTTSTTTTSSTTTTTPTTAPSTSTTTSSSTTTTTAPTTTTTTSPASSTVVLLAGTATPPANDKPIVSRLQLLGWNVTIVDDDTFTTSSLSEASLVVIASSVSPTKVPTWLATQPIPVLNAEAYAQKRLNMASAGGEIADQTTTRVSSTSHPLAAGLSGDVIVQTAARIGAATPSSGAVIVTQQPGSASAQIYGIETGAALTTGTAPARRVGFFFSYDSPAKLTTNGWAFFDAAVRWLAPA